MCVIPIESRTLIPYQDYHMLVPSQVGKIFLTAVVMSSWLITNAKKDKPEARPAAAPSPNFVP